MTPQETILEFVKNLGVPLQAGTILSIVLTTIWGIIKTWWWTVPPFLLYPPFLFLWLWWRQEIWDKKQERIILEIRMPREVLKPIKAMENVFYGFWALYDAPNWKEKWFHGKFLLSFSCEIVSIGGESKFYLRVPAALRNVFESSIYSQYPEAEIFEAEDYTRNIPLNIPSKDWDIWGTDYKQFKEDIYPIRTYKEFEEKSEAKEEKRIDPIASLLEGLSKIGPGEQLWVQFIIKPISPQENDWVERGKTLVNKLVKRPEKTKPKPIIQEAADILIKGEPPGMKKEEKMTEFFYPEMMLTPGEREVVSGVEDKIKKFGFETNIRFLYIAKRDVFFKPNVKIPLGFFNQFSTWNLNGLKPWARTKTSINYPPFMKRRLYLRKRNIFRRYLMRVSPLFPTPGGTFILNIEELASLFHFPGRAVAPAPAVTRVEAKKGEAPPGLPTG